MIKIRSLDRSAKIDVIRYAAEQLAALGLPDPWPEATASLERAESLEAAADAVTMPRRPPPDPLLVDRLASGDLDPESLPELLADGRAADDAERVTRLLRNAAERARMTAVDSVRRTGDLLVTSHLAPAAQRALRAGDAHTWCRLADVADTLRGAQLLPAKLAAVDKRFDERDYRLGRPERLTVDIATVGPDELLALALEHDAQPTIRSDEQLYAALFPKRKASRQLAPGPVAAR